jgi:hypothetical protein
MKSQPITETEFDHLNAVLERFGDRRIQLARYRSISFC